MYILYVWFEKSLIISVNIFENSSIVINNFILDSFLDTAGTYHLASFLGHKGDNSFLATFNPSKLAFLIMGVIRDSPIHFFNIY